MRRFASHRINATAFAAIVCILVINAFLASAQVGDLDPQDPTPLVKTMGHDYFTADQNPTEKAYLAMVQGRHASELTWSAYRAGSYNAAIADCKYTLARFPNHPGALFLMGEIAKATHDPAMAIPYFEDALKFYPQHAYTHAQYGHYLTEIDATAVGIAELQEALRIDPAQFQARAWLAEAQKAGQGPAAPSDSAKADSTGSSAGRSRAKSKH